MSPEAHDDMLFEMLKECKTLPTFLDHVFGFLKRRTDFYVVAESQNSPVGLLPGLAESVVKHTYFKYTSKETDNKKEVKTKSNSKESPSIPDISNIKVSTDLAAFEERLGNDFFTDASKSYNGAVYDHYCWTQNYNDLGITIKLPKNVKSKDLVVTVGQKRVNIKLADETVLLEGDLCHQCKNSEVVWSVDNNELQIHVEKMKEIWWDCLLTTEPKLDIRKMDCVKPLEDLPEDAQAKIYELQYNEEQKRLGVSLEQYI